VGAGVEATGGDVEADFRKEGLEELFLISAGVVAAKIRAGGGRGKGESFFGNGDEAWAEFFEKSSYVFGEPAWFVAFKKGIVGLVGVSPQIGHLPREHEKFFEVRGKGREVGVFAGLDPRGAGEANGELVFLDKFGRDSSGAMVIVAPTGDGGGFGGVWVR
jgi:hypothetical protein